MGLFSSLKREQKEALGLLQIGTFLEYFDMMLYVHMGVLLNELFFPKTDPQTAALLAAFTFCSTFVFRPIGAIIFGWMGDHIGRKSTIVLTTSIMAVSCLIMANLPTYAQIGIGAAWMMTICRIAQGMSSLGEIVGAQIYVAESVTRPAAYPAVAFINVSAATGGMFALGIATLVMSAGLNWRLAFWIGAAIAIVGSVARTRLRETPDFLELKRQQMKEALSNVNKHLEGDEKKPKSKAEQSGDQTTKQNFRDWKETVEAKTLLSYFLIYCGWALCFYLAFIYFNSQLKEQFGYTPTDIIKHNFVLSIISVSASIFVSTLSYRVHPLKILKVRAILILLLMISMPFLITNLTSPIHLFMIQAFILLVPLDGMPADAVFIYHFPVWRRFTYASFLFALPRALISILTSFGLVYLSNYFGPYGLWFITLPITIAFLCSVFHFEGLEHKLGLFKPNPFFRTYKY